MRSTGDGHTHTFHHLTISPHFFSSSSSDPNWNLSGTNSQLRFAPDFAWLLREVKITRPLKRIHWKCGLLSCPSYAFTQKAYCVKESMGPWKKHLSEKQWKDSSDGFRHSMIHCTFYVPTEQTCSSGVQTSDKHKLFCAKHSHKVSLIKNLLDLKQSDI